MVRYLLFAFLATQISFSVAYIISNKNPNDKELVLVFTVNRHGERSPDADELSLSDAQDKLKNLTYLEGLEGLTLQGKRRGYQLGHFLRERYGREGLGVLSELYLPQEIAVRSTDKERTKMTALIAMSAVYPPVPEQQWNDKLGKIWQPVPYSSLPLNRDYLRYYSNCKAFKNLMAKAKHEALQHELKPYLDLIPVIKEKTGKDFTSDPLLFQTLFDLYKSQTALGIEIPEWAKPLMPRIAEAAALAYKLYYKNNEMKKIGGGVLLSEFLNAASDFVTGKSKQKKLHMFSAHDFNLGSLMEVTDVKKPENIPEYGSLFALELYKSKSRGDYSVLPVYLPKAGDSTAENLQFKNCGTDGYCDLQKFVQQTKNFVLTEQEFNRMCFDKY